MESIRKMVRAPEKGLDIELFMEPRAEWPKALRRMARNADDILLDNALVAKEWDEEGWDWE